jgi:hypothetical protein
MDPAQITSVKRGKFHQLRYDDQPIEIPFKGIKIIRDVQATKTDRCVYDKFTRIDITHAQGNKGDLLLIHNYIKSKASPNFSPMKYAEENNSWGDIVTKIKSDRYLSAGDNVDGLLCPGSFGSHGWCLTLKLTT